MKRLHLILILSILCLGMMAQHPTANGRAIAERKQQLSELTNRYVQAFGLEGQTADNFRTIFLEYNKQLHTIKQQHTTSQHTNGAIDDETQDAIIRARFARQRAILDTRIAYYEQLRNVLSPSQIQTIYDDERKRLENMTK